MQCTRCGIHDAGTKFWKWWPCGFTYLWHTIIELWWQMFLKGQRSYFRLHWGQIRKTCPIWLKKVSKEIIFYFSTDVILCFSLSISHSLWVLCCSSPHLTEERLWEVPSRAGAPNQEHIGGPEETTGALSRDDDGDWGHQY